LGEVSEGYRSEGYKVAVIGGSVRFVRMFVVVSVRSTESQERNTCSYERLFDNKAGLAAHVNPGRRIFRTFVPGTDV
jgi:hypothetical protein